MECMKMKRLVNKISMILIATNLLVAYNCYGEMNYLLNNYLASPSGKYNVGFKDFHWINSNACPTMFLKYVNKKNFSKSNKKYCDEINVRFYYPTKEVGSSNYVPLGELKKTIKKYSKNVKLDTMQDIRSYTKRNAIVAKGKFPVIIFSSGYDVLPQMYENVLTDLASYGYIVVGVNSEFINGPFKLPSGKIAKTFLPTLDQQKKDLFIITLNDLGYVYKRVKSKNIKSKLVSSMDTSKIGLIGHSLGAATVVHFAEKADVQAVATLDLAWDNIYPNTCRRTINAPFMELFSSLIYLNNKSGNFPYLCKDVPLRKEKQVYVLRNKLIPNQKNYSVHMSFSDQATLQYEPNVQAILKKANSNPQKRFTGLGNGWDITNAVNTQLILFFKQYL